MIDPNPKRSEEPIWWSLFGAGGTWFAMMTPITIMVFGILMPLGIVEPSTFSYDNVSAHVGTIMGGAIAIATLSLPMWHAMHRVHHGMHDLKMHTGLAGKVVCYGIASLISVVAIVCVIWIW